VTPAEETGQRSIMPDHSEQLRLREEQAILADEIIAALDAAVHQRLKRRSYLREAAEKIQALKELRELR